MKTEVLNVTGMTCGGCVTSVKHALSALPGVSPVAVSLPKNQVEVQYDESKLAVEQIGTALQGAGYGIAASPAKAGRQGGGCCS